MDASFSHFEIVRSSDYRLFLEKEATLRNFELAFQLCDDSADAFDQKMPPTLLLFKQVGKPQPHARGGAVIFAADFGKPIVDHHAKEPPSVPAQKRLLERGFHSLKYAVNGIEHFILLDPARALPVFAVTFKSS
jgi:hypothetical protein